MDLFQRTKELATLHQALEDHSIARIYMPNSDMVRASSLLLNTTVLEYEGAFPGSLAPETLTKCRTESQQLAEHFFLKEPIAFNGAASALVFYRIIKDPKAEQLEAKLDESGHYREEMDQLYASGRLQKLMDLQSAHTFDLTLLKIFSAAELGRPELAEKLCDELSKSVAGNGFRAEHSLDVYTILGQTETLSQKARECYEYPLIWEWQKRVLDFHLGMENAETLLADAYPFNNSMCVANYTVGLRYLSEGECELAKKHFRIAHQTGRYGWHHFHMARLFLKRLEDDPAFPSWIPLHKEQSGGEQPLR